MICIIACGSNKVANIKENLDSLNVASEIIEMSETATVDFEKYSGVIISGSPILVTVDGMDAYLEKFHFLARYTKPVFGICFGHQVLCLLYGAKGYLGEMILRDEVVNIHTPGDLFVGLGSKATFSQNHREYMSLPEDFELLASSASCPLEAMQHKHKPLYGVQFHPEVSGEAGHILFKNFVHICKDATL